MENADLKGELFMKILKWLDNNLEVLICGTLLLMLSVAMMLQVIMRYVLNAALSWPEEFSRYCYIWITFFSISLTIRSGSYFRVTALVDILSRKGRQIAEILVHCINLIFFGACAYYSIDIFTSVFNSTQSSPALRIPIYIIYIALPLGMFLSTFRSIQMIILNVRMLTGKKNLNVSQKEEENKNGY